MKQINDMSFSELKECAYWLCNFTYGARDVSEAIAGIVGDDDDDDILREFVYEVSVINRKIIDLKNSIYAPNNNIDEADVIDDARVFVSQMMKLCNNISVNLSHRFNKIFGWTEVNIHEVVNGFVEDGDLNGKEQA